MKVFFPTLMLMMVFSIRVCKKTFILFCMAVYKINYMYILIKYTKDHFI